MPQKLRKTDYRYHAKLAQIRKDNVKRHTGYENSLKLRENIKRYQANATYDMEHDRLRHATLQGHVAGHAHKRLADLKNLLGK